MASPRGSALVRDLAALWATQRGRGLSGELQASPVWMGWGKSVSGEVVECWIPATQVGRHQTRPSGIKVLPRGDCLGRKSPTVLQHESDEVAVCSEEEKSSLNPHPNQLGSKEGGRETALTGHYV